MSNTNVGRLIGGTTRTDGIQTLSNIHQTKMASAWPLSRYSEGGISPALALDFIDGKYRLGKTAGSFSDAFIGDNPKLTYSTSGGSNSTMVNSTGNIVWAPHNLLGYSEDFLQGLTGSSPVFVKDADVQIGTTNNDDPAGGQTATQINVSGSGRIYANVTSGDYFTSVYLKPGTFSNFRVAGFFIDLGVTPPTNSDPNGSIDVLPNNWFRVTVGYVGARPFQVQAYPDATYPVHTQSGDYQIWGAHVCRSDLGGMAQVPGADTGFETYVPTNGNAEYLPRVGHHVYNGSAWVNEGMLIESEPRTNLFQYSDFSSGWDETGVDPIALDATGPDGQANTAVTLNEDSTAGEHKLSELIAAVPASTYTSSVFVKLKPSDTRTKIRLRNLNFVTNNNHGDFDLVAETVTKGSAADNATIENIGNGWFRCSVTSTSTAQAAAIITVYLLDASGNTSYTGDGASGVLIYGAQLEQGQVVNGTPTPAPTPSSYMPTYGNQFTRTAQSLTVPPAEFGWPEPEYIGSELLSAFSDASWTTTTGEWTYDAANDEWDLAVSTAGSTGALNHDITVTEGSVYVATATVSNVTNVSANELFIRINNTEAGNVDLIKDDGSGAVVAQAIGGDGTYTTTFVAGASTPSFQIRAGGASDGDETATLVSASVREINPLSVSIQMDGRMTYADNDTNGRHSGGEIAEVGYYSWNASSTEWISARLDTADTRTGSVVLRQSVGPVSPNDTYSPGINVPFNIASRHGSTFVNGAVDGVALTANTTPTALPDLSSTDLAIAYDFMGTISQFRQFAGDIGDAGLVTATNPSTEPTLSLTFDGTGGSFYNLSWSE